MSRSFKHTPYAGDRKNRLMKRYANKKLRRKKLTHNLQYKSYKKDFCYYDICDYSEIQTSFEAYYEQRIANWYRYKYGSCPTEEECWQEYYKYFIRK